MTRSHPPSLITLTKRLVRRERLFRRGDRVLVGCSGGPDSTALLHALAHLRREIGHELCALGVDHGLRPEAGRELDRAAEVARSCDVAFSRTAVEVSAGSNVQARARAARHRALQHEAASRGAAVVALGHTADDRAETVVARLLRGSGPRGLAVMPARSGGIGGDVPIVRPLLQARRADVEAHVARHRLEVATDPSNRDPRYQRTRVRHEILPRMAECSPNVVEHLCALADALAKEPEDPWADLSRSQRQMIRQAIVERRSGTTVRMSGGVDLELRFFRASADTGDET